MKFIIEVDSLNRDIVDSLLISNAVFESGWVPPLRSLPAVNIVFSLLQVRKW